MNWRPVSNDVAPEVHPGQVVRAQLHEGKPLQHCTCSRHKNKVHLLVNPQVVWLVWSDGIPVQRQRGPFWCWISCPVLLWSTFWSDQPSLLGKVGPHLDEGGGHEAVLRVEWVVHRPERVPEEVQLIADCGS